MAILHYQQQHYKNQKKETVLETLLNANLHISHGCRQGVCQSCLLRSLDNPPPTASQQGLQEHQVLQHQFLSCLCLPEQDMHIAPIEQTDFAHTFKVLSKNMLNHDTLLVQLQHDDGFSFKAGQFINLKSTDNRVRSYSISNLPNSQHTLNLHIRLLENGHFSQWMQHDVAIGDNIPASLALGHCFYTPEKSAQKILLVGTGSGLAPLYGILQDALRHQHQGMIHLFHGSRHVENLYLEQALHQLVKEHKHLHYTPCVSGLLNKEHQQTYVQGRVHEVALAHYPSLNHWRVYLCGHPQMVKYMQTQVFLKGVDMNDIYVDAFHFAHE